MKKKAPLLRCALLGLLGTAAVYYGLVFLLVQGID